GMTLGIMPVTGLPLPFVSYGASSILPGWGSVRPSRWRFAPGGGWSPRRRGPLRGWRRARSG
ncbi:FtsW/RodA/SpoVE family cell cycle protein, partial [Streptomyces sp. AS58]|uniref:FtsW/RodA/SpoVE family cell cycle protein n=1 Tax=Streptomyces sp. AS58 TaxID=1519489 RepID=UPI001F2560BF